MAGLSPKLLREAFALAPVGGESDMEDEGNGEYYAVRVDKITPPATPGLDPKIREPLTKYFMRQGDGPGGSQAKAEALARRRSRRARRLEAAAAEAGAKLGHAPNVTRARP